MHRYLSLIVFVAVVLGVGLLIGSVTMPGEWYASLNKPPFNPPGWVFGPVWTVLYIAIAVAGWRVWQRDPQRPLMVLWVMQLLLNFLWSPVFFGAEQIGAALVVVIAMLVAILAFIVLAWPRDRLAAWLFVPYAAWTAFATLLTGSIFVLN